MPTAARPHLNHADFGVAIRQKMKRADDPGETRPDSFRDRCEGKFVRGVGVRIGDCIGDSAWCKVRDSGFRSGKRVPARRDAESLGSCDDQCGVA